MVSARPIEYVVDGRPFAGRLAVPDGRGPYPAVLIADEGGGLDDVQRARADDLAERGYVAFALDYHGERAPFADFDAMRAALAELSGDPDRVRALGRAGLDVVLAEPTVDPDRVAAIGYCFGGTLVLELARDGADLKAIVGFHPGLGSARPEDSRNIVGKVLICAGSDDPIVPVADRLAFQDEMSAAGVDWQVHVHGGARHSFTHRLADFAGMPELGYHEAAARRSWRAMLDLFDDAFGA